MLHPPVLMMPFSVKTIWRKTFTAVLPPLSEMIRNSLREMRPYLTAGRAESPTMRFTPIRCFRKQPWRNRYHPEIRLRIKRKGLVFSPNLPKLNLFPERRFSGATLPWLYRLTIFLSRCAVSIIIRSLIFQPSSRLNRSIIFL